MWHKIFELKQQFFSKFIKPKILLIKVVWYDSLIIKIPIKGGLTNCLASEELLSEATATPRRQRNAGQGTEKLTIPENLAKPCTMNDNEFARFMEFREAQKDGTG